MGRTFLWIERMPELPEVETMVRDLTPRVLGRTITAVDAPFEGTVAWPSFPEFVDRVSGSEITHVSRRGKYATFSLASGDALIVHRGMTGSLLLRSPADAMESYVRLILHLDMDLELRFTDPRKFGKIFVMESTGAERPLPWAQMGPEPLNGSFTADALGEALGGRTALIKSLLLNQHIVAGLGNIYVDEALYRAGIHPARRAHTLSSAEIERLAASIKGVLTAAVEGRGTTFNSYVDIEGRAGLYQRDLQVFRKAGSPCPRCGTSLERLVVAGRGTHICPHCQPA
jgi:formamidopyrimidine-DNA glycosylase